MPRQADSPWVRSQWKDLCLKVLGRGEKGNPLSGAMGDPVHVNPCSLRGITDSNFHPPILFKLNICRDQSLSSRGRLDSQLQLLSVGSMVMPQ